MKSETGEDHIESASFAMNYFSFRNIMSHSRNPKIHRYQCHFSQQRKDSRSVKDVLVYVNEFYNPISQKGADVEKLCKYFRGKSIKLNPICDDFREQCISEEIAHSLRACDCPSAENKRLNIWTFVVVHVFFCHFILECIFVSALRSI